MNKYIIFLTTIITLFSPVYARGQTCVIQEGGSQPTCISKTESQTDEEFRQMCECANCRISNGPCPIGLENPLQFMVGDTSGEGVRLSSQQSIPIYIGGILSRALVLVGALTLLVFIYGGFLWLTSAGNEEKVRHGFSAMLYAAIGLFVIFASYGILSLVIQGLQRG